MVGKKNDAFKKISSSQILDSLINKAIETRASFIHIEPGEAEVLVRYRVNGSLVEIDRFSKNKLNSLTERIKKLANLEARIRDIPQDGRFKVREEDSTYTMRVSILPTIDGEKISINILSSSEQLPSLTDLGYWGMSLKYITNAMSQSNGVILLSGPRDSGKSLSLVSMLSNVSKSDLRIATIEDPVEYTIKRANQTQVNHKNGLTFANGLKAMEKQDNDIIMVSELRDSEVANLVFHYGSRGKLILATVYANNVYESLSRLIDAGVSRSLIAHSLRIISNQRLVRQLCETCRESFDPDKATLSLVNQIFGLNDPAKMKYIHKLEVAYNQEIGNKKTTRLKDLNTTEGRIKKLWKAHEGGCEDCFHTGYKGRVGLYEIVNVSPGIQKLILSLASPKVLLDKTTREGTISILVDGLVKSLQGKTSINEVFRLQQEHI